MGNKGIKITKQQKRWNNAKWESGKIGASKSITLFDQSIFICLLSYLYNIHKGEKASHRRKCTHRYRYFFIQGKK